MPMKGLRRNDDDMENLSWYNKIKIPQKNLCPSGVFATLFFFKNVRTQRNPDI